MGKQTGQGSRGDWITNYSVQAILFSHPGDFTPVCTTELGEVARRAADFEKRGVKVIGLSVDSNEQHGEWIKDINNYGSTNVQFPIVCLSDVSGYFWEI